MQTKNEKNMDQPNSAGVAFSANRIKSATNEIIYSGKALEKYANEHPMTDDAKKEIFKDLSEQSGNLLNEYWIDKQHNPDDYLAWKNENSSANYITNFSEIPSFFSTK